MLTIILTREEVMETEEEDDPKAYSSPPPAATHSLTDRALQTPRRLSAGWPLTQPWYCPWGTPRKGRWTSV